MSTILDALKKAESERRAGTAPSLHAPPLTPVAPEIHQPSHGFPWPPATPKPVLAATLAAGVLTALALGAGLSQLLESEARTSPPAAVPSTFSPDTEEAKDLAKTSDDAALAALASAVDAAPATESAAPATVAPEVLLPPPPPETEPEPKARPKRVMTRPAPHAASSSPSHAAATASAVSDSSPSAAARAPTTAAATGAGSNWSSLPTREELPAALRAAIPAMEVGGYIYSSKEAERSILIDRRLRVEGDEIAPGLRLERMTPDGLVLNYRGTRFRRSY